MILQRCTHPHPCYDDGKCHYKGECGHKAPLTNADRIRAMTDEELAELLFQVGYDNGWGMKEYALEWLQQPAEEDEHASFEAVPYMWGKQI